jgi:hypothetical protein
MNINQHDLSDDELDRLFSDAAEKMDADFDPDSWTKMSQKLDVANSATSGKSQAYNVWLKRGLLLLLVSLFMVGGYYFIKPSAKSEQETTRQTKQKNSPVESIEENTKNDVATDKVDTDNLENKKTTIEQNSNKDTNPSESSNYKETNTLNNTITTNKKVASTNKFGKQNQNSINKQAIVLEKSQNIILAKKHKDVAALGKQSIDQNHQTFETPSIKTNESLAINDIAESGFSSSKSETNIVSNKNKKAAKTKKSNINIAENIEQNYSPNNSFTSQTPTSQNTEISTQTPQIAEETEVKNILGNLKNLMPKNGNFKAKFTLPIIAFESPKITPILPKSTSFNKGLYLRLGISPDFSVVSFDETTKLGSNWAVLLEYRIDKRLSVQAGVIRSMKYYNAYPASYEWPTNWGTVPYSLVDINASCKMLDIPLNVRFDLSQKSKSRWFVGAGLTSYVMKNEKYTYNYENPNSTWIKWREWEGVSQKKPFYISTLNFSLGYEQQFFRKLSIQAEPFYKTPLKKVGFGKVNLSTIGILISAKYPIAKF